MKTIFKERDDLYYLLNIHTDDGTVVSPSDLDAITIELFTSGQDKCVKTASDISEEGILHVNASDLAALPDGPLKFRIHLSLPDDGFDDSKYDQTAERLTGYFLKTLPQ